jgi:hypothetical protein
VVWQLNNLELAVNLAKRGNLPGAENLVRVQTHTCVCVCVCVCVHLLTLLIFEVNPTLAFVFMFL